MVGGDADDKDEHESDDEQDDVDHDDCIVGGGGADWLEVMLQAAPLIPSRLLSPPSRPLTHSHPPHSQVANTNTNTSTHSPPPNSQVANTNTNN